MGSHTPPDHSSQQQHPQQQYCLRWNNYQNNLTNVFDQLLQAEAFVDVTLSAEGHSLKAHKVVLSACSPYFQALFFDNPCKHPIVILSKFLMSLDSYSSLLKTLPINGWTRVSFMECIVLCTVAQIALIAKLVRREHFKAFHC